jgi:hypothetical protein
MPLCDCNVYPTELSNLIRIVLAANRMRSIPALFTFLGPGGSRPSPADATTPTVEPVPLKSALRQPVLSLRHPLSRKKTVRMSLPAYANGESGNGVNGRYHDFDYRQTRGVRVILPVAWSNVGC